MIVKELFTKWGVDVDDQALDSLDQKIKKVDKSLKSVADKTISLGKSLSAFVTLPVLGLGAAFVSAASDSEETESKFNTIFRSITKEAQATADALGESFGLSFSKSRELLGGTADLLTGFGFTQKSALGLANQVQELAVDLASFTNFSGGAEGASAALTKALLGERESVKSLGISILEEDVKKQIAIDRSRGMTFETERQAKANATLQIALRQSKNAIGDFARTSQSFANQFRLVGQDVNDMAVSFGKLLLPAAKGLIKIIRSIIKFFKDMAKGTKVLLLVLGGIVATIGPLLIGLGTLLTLLPLIQAGFLAATGAVAAFKLSMVALPALILAIAGLIFLIVDDLIAFFRGDKSVTAILVEKFREAAKDVPGFLMQMWERIKEIFSSIGKTIGESLVGAFSKLKEIALDAFTVIKTKVLTVIDSLIERFNKLSTFQKVLLGVFAVAALPFIIKAITSATRSLLNLGTRENVKGGVGERLKETSQVTQGEDGFLSTLLKSAFVAPPVTRASTQAPPTQKNSSVINAPITVTVPEGTPIDLIGNAIRQGLTEGLAESLRKTSRSFATSVIQ